MPPARLDAYSPLKQCCWQPTPVRLGLRQQVRTIRSIQKQIRPSSRFNTSPSLPVLGASAASAIERRLASDTLPLRSGALATKKGMTAIYDPQTGVRSPCTILQLDRVQVVAHKTRERHGYYAVCVGSGWRHPTNVGNAMLGVFAKTTIKDTQGGNVGLSPKKFIREFRVKDETGLLGIGQMVTAKWFQEGQFVDARSNARGMGFAGVSARCSYLSPDVWADRGRIGHETTRIQRSAGFTRHFSYTSCHGLGGRFTR